jgi:hypothetical protein
MKKSKRVNFIMKPGYMATEQLHWAIGTIRRSAYLWVLADCVPDTVEVLHIAFLFLDLVGA